MGQENKQSPKIGTSPGFFAEKFHNSPPVARIELKIRPMAMMRSD